MRANKKQIPINISFFTNPVGGKLEYGNAGALRVTERAFLLEFEQ
jgi:hypothetical protein